MALLSAAEIQSRVGGLAGWVLEGQTLRLEKRFRDFVEAIAFINRLVEPAEAAGHHPDLSISYNRVTVSLTTHDAGGLTSKDFELAEIISTLT